MKANNFFLGLYGNNTIEFVRGLINVHPFGEIGKIHNNKVALHLHNNLFQIFYIEAGQTTLNYENFSQTIKGPALITIPKNTPHGFEHGDNIHTIKGWIITLSENVLENLLNREAEVLYTLNKIYATEITADTFTQIVQTIEKIIAEYFNDFPGKLVMLQNLVGQLIIELFRLQNFANKLNFVSDNSYKVYFRKFLQNIAYSKTFKKTVDQYASELKITTAHLARITKEISNQSPKEVILNFFITEAKILLTNPEFNINEVAQKLNIDDPSYFSRLFKKATSLTPKEFQKVNNVK